jgi:insulysin
MVVQIICVGYNHKMRILLDMIISKIGDFEVRPDRFSVIKVIYKVDIFS